MQDYQPSNAADPSPNPISNDLAQNSLAAILKDYPGLPSRRPERLSEEQVSRISDVLAWAGHPSWSKIPRIYAVLHMIGKVRTIDAFINEGISDLWFPFSPRTLPEGLRSASDRHDFVEVQDLVLTKALDLEREDGRHRHFSRPDEIPLRKLAELGKGGFGSVDRVLSTITHREYARKVIHRGKTFRKNAEKLRDFERELNNLKKLRHEHIVQLIGSYTDQKYVCILMAPVADANLREFLVSDSLTTDHKSLLRTFYGCLATAVQYLHENQVRHKDIKPQNILVKGHQVYLTDFGISLDWSDIGQSTTTGHTVKTERYCAPEVAQNLHRNTLSDLWSLGCVFLEIWTVLKGETLTSLYNYIAMSGMGSTCYHHNLNTIMAWGTELQAKTSSSSEDPPFKWIEGLLQPDQDFRWSAQKLVARITDVNDDPENSVLFLGTCCADNDDSSISEVSSMNSSKMLDETGASSVGVYEPPPKMPPHLPPRNPSGPSGINPQPSHAMNSNSQQEVSTAALSPAKAIDVAVIRQRPQTPTTTRSMSVQVLGADERTLRPAQDMESSTSSRSVSSPKIDFPSVMGKPLSLAEYKKLRETSIDITNYRGSRSRNTGYTNTGESTSTPNPPVAAMADLSTGLTRKEVLTPTKNRMFPQQGLPTVAESPLSSPVDAVVALNNTFESGPRSGSQGQAEHSNNVNSELAPENRVSDDGRLPFVGSPPGTQTPYLAADFYKQALSHDQPSPWSLGANPGPVKEVERPIVSQSEAGVIASTLPAQNLLAAGQTYSNHSALQPMERSMTPVSVTRSPGGMSILSDSTQKRVRRVPKEHELAMQRWQEAEEIWNREMNMPINLLRPTAMTMDEEPIPHDLIAHPSHTRPSSFIWADDDGDMDDTSSMSNNAPKQQMLDDGYRAAVAPRAKSGFRNWLKSFAEGN